MKKLIDVPDIYIKALGHKAVDAGKTPKAYMEHLIIEDLKNSKEEKDKEQTDGLS